MIEAIIMGGVLISFFALGYLSATTGNKERIKELERIQELVNQNSKYYVSLSNAYSELQEKYEALKEQKNG